MKALLVLLGLLLAGAAYADTLCIVGGQLWGPGGKLMVVVSGGGGGGSVMNDGTGITMTDGAGNSMGYQ